MAFDTIMQRRFILPGTALAWLLFAASFLMPVTKHMDLTGWQAFWFYVAEIWDWPNFWRKIQLDPLAALASSFPVTNGLMFVAPVILLRWPRWSGALGGYLAFGGAVALSGFFEMIVQNELRAGFYCWVISILLMALLCLLDWTQQRRMRRRER